MSEKEMLIKFICENFYVEEEDIDTDASLVQQGIIDSIGLVEISAFLEKEFNIETSMGEMNQENFGSIEKIVSYVNLKKKSGSDDRRESGEI